MDILNFISWIRGGRVVTSVDPDKTLLPVGLKDGRRDDGYLAGAISVEDLVAQIVPQPAYKVFTALLTQSGGDNLITLNSGLLTIGTTYWINEAYGVDFTNVGAPNNESNTFFVATGTTPNSWGPHEGDPSYDILLSNTGAPVVTILENTIGYVWFTYDSTGIYYANSNNLFELDKTVIFMGTQAPNIISGNRVNNNLVEILTFDTTNQNYSDNKLQNTPIEIRVYN